MPHRYPTCQRPQLCWGPAPWAVEKGETGLQSPTPLSVTSPGSQPCRHGQPVCFPMQQLVQLHWERSLRASAQPGLRPPHPLSDWEDGMVLRAQDPVLSGPRDNRASQKQTRIAAAASWKVSVLTESPWGGGETSTN